MRAAFFGLSADPLDRDSRGLASAPAGLRYFWDFDQQACAALGLAGHPRPSQAVFLIDPAFRILMAAPIEETGHVLDRLQEELALEASAAETPGAPVLVLPRVFEPDFCALLIDYFEGRPAQDSGFAAEVDGRTELVVDRLLKRRRDVPVEHPQLEAAIEARLIHCTCPWSRWPSTGRPSTSSASLVARYAAAGRPVAHRRDDVVTWSSAHRKFAVTVNLNAGVRWRGPRIPRVRGASLPAAHRRGGGVQLLVAP